jgi:DNA-binding NtrC family response regulator
MRDTERLRAAAVSLRSARTFEDAATAALAAMLAAADAALAGSAYAGRGRVLRGMVHFRPGEGYRRLWVIERDAAGAPIPAAIAGAYLPSATAWRWIAEHGAAIAVDVHAGLLHPDRSAPLALPEGATATLALRSDETRARLLGRDATHVYVTPLRAPGGAVSGMISLEVECRAAMGRPFVWPDVAEALDLLADLAAPHLASLPLRPAQTAATDELLPVIGAATAGLAELLRVFAQQEETILLAGPTGAGKSRLARFCHARSRRREQRFEVLDLLTVPEDLQMGELFGYRRGAFTGAVKDNPGAVARAEGGTLFIDEIDKLSLKVQASLLRVLEERVYRSIGDGDGERRADVRFLVGTNADLLSAVRAGRFREDLYYRINVLPVRVPPLAERRDEIPGWAAYMLARRHREGGGAGTATLAEDAERLLAESAWPGNLRQLDNIVRRAYALLLADHGAPGDVVLGRKHVERALAYERAGSAEASEATLLDELRRAARAFAREASRREGLTLDAASAFPGLVLEAAVEQHGGRDEAFKALGRADLLKNRNHHRVYKRELDVVETLLAALGER